MCLSVSGPASPSPNVNSFEFDNPLVPLVGMILSQGESFVSRASMTTSLLFCIGPLTILGSLEDGLTGDYSLLALKSALALAASLSFAPVLRWGSCSRRGS